MEIILIVDDKLNNIDRIISILNKIEKVIYINEVNKITNRADIIIKSYVPNLEHPISLLMPIT